MTPSTEPFCGICRCSFWRATEKARRHPPIPRRHASMQACVRLDDGECSRLSLTWGNIFGKGVCSRRFFSSCFSRRNYVPPSNDSSLMQPSRTTWCSCNEIRKEGRRRGHHVQAKSTGGGGEEEEEVQRLWGMLYADDAGIVSRSPEERLGRMIKVIVIARSAFGLTVSEPKRRQ